MRAFYATPADSQGHALYPGGLQRGSGGVWPRFPLQPRAADLARGRNGCQLARYLAFVPDGGPAYNSLKFDFDRDPQRMVANERMYDATNPNLRPFRAHGGKLIMFSGWADEAMPPLATVKFYNEIVQKMGGPAGDTKIRAAVHDPGSIPRSRGRRADHPGGWFHSRDRSVGRRPRRRRIASSRPKSMTAP